MGRLETSAACVLLIMTSTLVAAEPPEAISEKGATVVFEAHAEGAQIYQCKADAGGNVIWQFREPIASLFEGEKTVGRHYGGPT